MRVNESGMRVNKSRIKANKEPKALGLSRSQSWSDFAELFGSSGYQPFDRSKGISRLIRLKLSAIGMQPFGWSKLTIGMQSSHSALREAAGDTKGCWMRKAILLVIYDGGKNIQWLLLT